VVVEKALASWRSKCEQRVRTLKASIAAAEKRLANSATEAEKAHQRAMLEELRRGLPQAIERSVTDPATSAVTSNVTSTKVREGKGEGRDISKGEGESNNGAVAPRSPDLANQIFGQGLTWLQSNTGKTEVACRRLLGNWRKGFGTDEAFIAALGAAQREGPIDVVAWMQGAIKARSGQTPSPRAAWAEALP
jgi:hypothetical protein